MTETNVHQCTHRCPRDGTDWHGHLWSHPGECPPEANWFRACPEHHEAFDKAEQEYRRMQEESTRTLHKTSYRKWEEGE